MLRPLLLVLCLFPGLALAVASRDESPTSAGAAQALAQQTPPKTPPVRQEREPQRPDPEALEKGRLELNAILAAAGARASLPGRLNEFLLWPKVSGLRYDALETHRSRLLKPNEPWRTNDLTPRFMFANGAGHGYLLLELVTQFSADGDLRAQFRREVGAGDTYWAEVDGRVLRDEKNTLNTQRTYLGEYFYGLMPHSLCVFDSAMLWLRNERVDGRTVSVYTLRLPYPFEVEYGRHGQVFAVTVDPATHVIEQLQFADPYEAGVTVIVQYTDWVQVAVPEAQREVWRASLRSELEGKRETLGDEGLSKLVAQLDNGTAIVPDHILVPARRLVFDQRRGREREFLAADFHIEPLPAEATEQPWQTGKLFESPYRSDFFDPEPEELDSGAIPKSGANVPGSGGG